MQSRDFQFNLKVKIEKDYPYSPDIHLDTECACTIRLEETMWYAILDKFRHLKNNTVSNRGLQESVI